MPAHRFVYARIRVLPCTSSNASAARALPLPFRFTFIDFDERYVLGSATIRLLLVYVFGGEVIRVRRQQMEIDAPQ
jgi:hypothetical protein